MLHAVGIRIKSHDFSLRIDRIDLGRLVGHVNRREDAIFQDKAVHVAIGDVQSYNRTGVVDSFSDRYNRAGHIERREVAFAAPQEAVAMFGGAVRIHIARSHIISHHLTDVVDSKGHCPQHGVVTRHVECGESAVAPDEAMTCLVCIPGLDNAPVGSHNLAFRIDEAALRSGRIGRVERGEKAVVIEKGVRRPPSDIEGPRELARRVDSVDDRAPLRAGRVNRGKAAILQHKAMPAICIIKLSCDRVRLSSVVLRVCGLMVLNAEVSSSRAPQ
jgi:hypothetical protein